MTKAQFEQVIEHLRLGMEYAEYQCEKSRGQELGYWQGRWTALSEALQKLEELNQAKTRAAS